MREVTGSTRKIARVFPICAAAFLSVGAFRSDGIAQPAVDSYQTLPVVGGASDADAIDLDGDGALEVIVSDAHGNDVFVYWNDGFGWFEARTLVPIGQYSYWVVTGDLDADGDGDAAVGGSSGVFALMNAGGREFTVHGGFFAGPPSFQRPTVIDMDGDGHLDLVGASSAEPVITTVLGTGTGDFVRAGAQPLAGIASQIDVRDFDGDGTLDYLALERNRADDARHFELISGLTGAQIQMTPVSTGAGSMALGDFDEDGLVDVAINGGYRDRFSEILLFRGAADGTFREAGRVEAAAWIAEMVAADLDSDSHLDIAVTSDPNPATLTIGPTLFRGDGRLGFSIGPSLGCGQLPNRIRAKDVSRDGKLDLVVQLLGSEDVAVLLNDGTGRFSQPGAGPAVPPVWDCVTGDFDGDDHADVLISSITSRQIAFVSGDGTGGFGAATITDGVGMLETLCAGDLDGNGLDDVVGNNLLDGKIMVGLADASGSFTLSAAPPLFEQPSRAGEFSAADIDSDGDLDVVASRITGSHTAAGAVFLNDGTGALSPPIIVGPGASHAPVGIGDVDGDDRLDLVFGDGSRHARVFRQIDSIELTFVEIAPIGLRANTHPTDIAMADLNGDGVTDTLFASLKYGVAVCFGVGDGTFRPQSSYGRRCSRILAGDFNLDGAVDVGSFESRFKLFPGTGSGELGAGQHYGLSYKATDFDSADFDEDGLLDFVVAAPNSFVPEHRLTLLLGRDREVETCRRGNVNAGTGPITDVLYVNDSTGGWERRITVAAGDPLFAFVDRTPAATGPEPFALYAWIGEPRRSDARRLPFGIGVTCMPTPLSGDEPQPRVVWNNVPRSETWLGTPRFPSSPAPSEVLARPRGSRGPVVFFLQGIIADRGALNGRASVTNGVVVSVE